MRILSLNTVLDFQHWAGLVNPYFPQLLDVGLALRLVGGSLQLRWTLKELTAGCQQLRKAVSPSLQGILVGTLTATV